MEAGTVELLIGMFSPLEANQRTCGVNSPQSAALNQAGVETIAPHGNESSPE